LVAVCATPQDGGMEAGGFIERDEAEAEGYLAEKIGGGVSREELIESMEQLLVFTKKPPTSGTAIGKHLSMPPSPAPVAPSTVFASSCGQA